MKVKKQFTFIIIAICLISVFTLSVCALPATQIAPGIPEFINNLDSNPSGYAEYYFGNAKAEVFFILEKGDLVNPDNVYGSSYASGEDAKACEIRVKVWATNWLTGEKIYEEEAGGTVGASGYGLYVLTIYCDLWHSVTDTYHEEKLIHQDGTTSFLTVTGYTGS